DDPRSDHAGNERYRAVRRAPEVAATREDPGARHDVGPEPRAARCADARQATPARQAAHAGRARARPDVRRPYRIRPPSHGRLAMRSAIRRRLAKARLAHTMQDRWRPTKAFARRAGARIPAALRIARVMARGSCCAGRAAATRRGACSAAVTK